jgi:hypothetical protein
MTLWDTLNDENLPLPLVGEVRWGECQLFSKQIYEARSGE